MVDSQLRAPSDPNYVAREIETLIADNQLDLATKKLMDFASNFGRYRNRRVEALDIRRSFTQWREDHRRFPDSQRVQATSTQLVSRMGDFLYQILSENSNALDMNINNIKSDTEDEIRSDLSAAQDSSQALLHKQSPSTQQQEQSLGC